MVKEKLLDKSGIFREAVEREALRELPLENSADMNVNGERLGHAETVEANALRHFSAYPEEGFQPRPGLKVGRYGENGEAQGAGGHRPGRRRDVFVPVT